MEAADRLVLRTVRHGGPWPAVLALASVAGAALELALPHAVGRAVDDLATGGSPEAVAVCAAVLAALVACDGLRLWASGAAGARAAAWLRHRLVRHVLGVGPAMGGRFPAGDLATRIGVNAEETGRAPDALLAAAALLVPTCGALVALALIDPSLALTLLAGLVLILLVLRVFLRDTTALASGYQEAQGEIAARLVTALSGARTIAAAGTWARETDRVLAPLPRLRERGMALWRAGARAGVQAGVVVPLLEVAVIAVGGLRLAAGELTVGELYAAARYAVLGAGLATALGHVGRLARARSAAARVAEPIAEPAVAYGTRDLPPGPGTLELRGVTAGPLRGLDVVVPGGTVVAVVGRSGSGKSVLAALAGRLADPDEGTVLLDGVPLPELSRRALRQAVGHAFERPVLIGPTVGDAIALGLPPEGAGVPGGGEDVGDGAERVAAAARAACADGFIRRLPGGYRTPLRQAPMSGGEAQRIGLARAFAQGTRLLILDDATSSLDTVTERQITAALTGELGGRTRLIVAHRAATAARADTVIWLEDGILRGHDSHRALWTAHPAYRAVFQPAPLPEVVP